MTEIKNRHGKKGPHKRYFFCSAIQISEPTDKKKSNLRDQINLITKGIQSDSADQAKALFEKEFGIPPEKCDEGEGNGWYVAKGTGGTDIQRLSVTVEPKDLQRNTAKTWEGQFKGWVVYASGLKACTIRDGKNVMNFKDNDLVSLGFQRRVDEESNVPRPKIKKTEVFRRESIEGLVEVSG